MEDTDFTGDIVDSFIDKMEEHQAIAGRTIYDAEWLVTAMSPLPCFSVMDGEEENADNVEGTAGYNVYKLPMRVTYYTAPTSDERIAGELRAMRGVIKSLIFNSYQKEQIHPALVRLDYAGSNLLPIYDLDNRALFSNALLVNYDVFYEVMK